MKHGIVQIYTGDGKGKTTAAAGLAARALSRRMRVCWISFFKGTVPDPKGTVPFTDEVVEGDCPHFSNAGETALLRKWGADVFKFVGDYPCPSPFGKGGSRGILQKKLRQECLKSLGFISEIFKKNYDVIVLDEINIALRDGFLKESEILLLLKHKPKSAELVLTGKGATPGLIKAASLVTEMKKIRHPFDKGVKARPGIEY